VEKAQQSNLESFVPRLKWETALCTKVLSQKTFPSLPSYEGIVVATQCGVVNPGAHRAENDVKMAAGILYALIDRIRANGTPVETVQDLLNYQGQLSR
jgi:hypothetical protein